MVSVIIPARNEKYLEPTIKDILANAEGEVEVLVMLDGWIPDPQIQTNDPRVVFYSFPESIGQRQCINEGANLAKGKYILKCDAHTAFDKGFDVKLAQDCEYDWTVIPRMYNLDVDLWKPKLHKMTDYMYTSNKTTRELRAEYYTGVEYRRMHSRPQLIDDVMTGQGACFFMHKDRFWELGGMDEKHGGWGQMGTEVACKAWLSGGSLKVNKKTWFAHFFRGEKGGFPYPISGRSVEYARSYSRDLWLNNKWEGQKRPFMWMVEKFRPPTWEEKFPMKLMTEAEEYQYTFNEKRHPQWRGVLVAKLPADLILYEQAIWENKPTLIIECGTYYGGSSLFFGDMMNLVGGRVISIDKDPKGQPKHPNVTYLTGRSTSTEILDKIKSMIKPDDRVMVTLDSDHHRSHVKRELYYYSPFVSKGQYLVVEDIWLWSKSKREFTKDTQGKGGGEAVEWFLKNFREFQREPVDTQFPMTISRDGWIKRH